MEDGDIIEAHVHQEGGSGTTRLVGSHVVDDAILHSPKKLYRAILCQARLLAQTFDDPAIAQAHRTIARSRLERFVQPRGGTSQFSDGQTPDVKHAIVHLRQLATANLGWPHAVNRALEHAYGRRGKLKHQALKVSASSMTWSHIFASGRVVLASIAHFAEHSHGYIPSSGLADRLRAVVFAYALNRTVCPSRSPSPSDHSSQSSSPFAFPT